MKCTLLDLVRIVSEFATSDEEIVSVVTYLVNSGTVVLCGTFAGRRIECSSPLSHTARVRTVSYKKQQRPYRLFTSPRPSFLLCSYGVQKAVWCTPLTVWGGGFVKRKNWSCPLWQQGLFQARRQFRPAMAKPNRALTLRSRRQIV